MKSREVFIEKILNIFLTMLFKYNDKYLYLEIYWTSINKKD